MVYVNAFTLPMLLLPRLTYLYLFWMQYHAVFLSGDCRGDKQIFQYVLKNEKNELVVIILQYVL